jgi:nicotinamide riboside transporter PnuC
MHIIVANLIALIASLFMVYSGILKNKQEILLTQTIQIGLSITSNIILGGITGTIINALSFIRNILCYKNKLNTKLKIILTLLATILTLKFNNLGIIGLLPLISTIIYIWLMSIKKVIGFKIMIIFTMLMWGIYDIHIKSYTSAIFDFCNIIANIISIYQIKKNI